MSTPIRIAFVTTGLQTGGAEMMLYFLLSRLDRSRFEPHVISLRADGPLRARIEALNIKVLSPNMRPGSLNPLAWFRLLSILREVKPQILQGWMYHANAAVGFCQFALQRPRTFFSIHNSIYDIKLEKPLTRVMIKLGALFSKSCSSVLYCAGKTAQQHEALGYAKDKSMVLYNGFDTDRFKPDPHSSERLRKELGVKPDSLLVGLIARLDPHKDHPNFFKAAKEIADHNSRTYFVLAGKGVGAKEPFFAELLSKYQLEQRCFLLGERSDMPEVISGLDLLVSSSSSEAFPNVIGEAMSCGRLCVVTDVGDSGFMLDRFGVVVPPKDSSALAQAALKVLELNPAERARLGAEARKRIVDNFSIEQVAGRYQSLYSKAVQAR